MLVTINLFLLNFYLYPIEELFKKHPLMPGLQPKPIKSEFCGVPGWLSL